MKKYLLGLLFLTGLSTAQVFTDNGHGGGGGGLTDLSSFDTDDLSEGAVNKYATSSTVRGKISASGAINYNNSTGAITCQNATGSQVGCLTATDWTTFSSKANASHSHVISDTTGLQAALDLKANLASPTFTGVVSGVSKAMVNLGNADNTSDANKPVSIAGQAALDLKQDASGTAAAAKAAAVNDTAYNATTWDSVTDVAPSKNSVRDQVESILTTMAGKASTSHTHAESDVTNLVSDLALKAPLASPTFTGTISGVSASMVGLGNVTNTSDANKPVSTATQTALDLKVTASSDVNAAGSILQVGAYSAANVAAGATLANAATNFTTANAIVKHDANGNFQANNIHWSLGSVATSGGTTTITNSQRLISVFTGTQTHTLKLPAANTAAAGTTLTYRAINKSTGAVTVVDTGSNTLAVLASGTEGLFTTTDTSSANGVWGVAISLSDPVGLAATQTLTNKTINGASNTLSNLPAAGISGVIPIANLATGTPTGSKFIRDDGTLQAPPGGASSTFTTVSTTSTLDASTSDILCDTSGAARTLTLEPVGPVTGRERTVINTGTANNCTLDGNSSETITDTSGSANLTYIIKPKQRVKIKADTATWQVANENPFVYDITNNRVGLGTVAPTSIFNVEMPTSTAGEIKLGIAGNSGYGTSIGVDSSGHSLLRSGAGKKFRIYSNTGTNTWLEYDNVGGITTLWDPNGSDSNGMSFRLSPNSSNQAWLQSGSSTFPWYCFGGTNFGCSFGDQVQGSARVRIAAGTATNAPLKFVTGTNLTTPVAGVVEYDGTFPFTKSGAVRYRPGGVLTQFYTDTGNVGTGEDDLYSYTIPASTLDTNGHKIEAKYGGTFANSTSTKQVRAYFGGTSIFDSGALTITASASWDMEILCVRVSASVVRCVTKMNTSGASLAAYASYVEVTGLTLTNTQILKITGETAGAGTADNDIVAKLGNIEFKPNN